MSQVAIFWPMLAQVLLTYVVYLVLAKRRFVPLLAGKVKPRVYVTRGDEPAGSATASSNLMNQFELPVLFFVLCLALFVTSGANYLSVALAWLFVASRVVHAVIHLTYNNVAHRSAAFAAGYVILGIGWVLFALHVAGTA